MSFWKRLFGKKGEPDPYVDPEEVLAPIRDQLDAIRVPAIGLFPTNQPTFNRLGGLPLVPRDFVWPRKKTPHSFLAQLDMSTMGDPTLPSDGYLYFFYDNEQGAWGFDPEDRGGWSVQYFQGDPSEFSLAQPPPDLDASGIFRAQAVEPRPILVFPSSESAAVNALDMTEEQYDAFCELGQPAFGDNAMHQVLGVPDPIQGDDMEEECQFASNGISMGSGDHRQSPRYEELKEDSKQWRLLLQLDSCDETGFCWGDVGILYFWIKEGDLANRKFDDVWMVLQCT
jgi:uncharacterized protein YwqG